MLYQLFCEASLAYVLREVHRTSSYSFQTVSRNNVVKTLVANGGSRGIGTLASVEPPAGHSVVYNITECPAGAISQYPSGYPQYITRTTVSFKQQTDKDRDMLEVNI